MILKIRVNLKNQINQITTIQIDLKLNLYLKIIYYYMFIMNQEEENYKKTPNNESRRRKFTE